MAFGDTGILDDFNRANEGPPMTGWLDLVAGLVVVSNACGPSGPGIRSGYYDTVLTAADCEVFCTIASDPASNRSQYVYARLVDIGSGTTDGYALKFNKLAGTDTLQILRIDDGGETVLGADFSQELVAGDKFGLELVGDTLTAYVDTGSGWTSLGSRTDSTHAAAGYLGAAVTSGTIDDFGGGELAAGGTAIGLNVETDSVLGLTAEKTKAAGLVTETDTPLALTRVKSKALGLITETDVVLPVTVGGETAVGIAAETDAPLPMGPVKTKAIGLIIETDAPLGLTAQKSRALGLVQETAVVFGFTSTKTAFLGFVSETSTVLALTVPGTGSVVRFVTIAGEFETAVSLEGEFETAVVLAGEFDVAITLAGEL